MGKNKTKICSICGKAENKNWKRHWNTKHKGHKEIEWDRIANIP